MEQARRGAFLGLSAALLFGVSTPIAKHLVGDVRPQLLAGLLYAGAAIVLTGSMRFRRVEVEARLRRSDAPELLAVTFFGGVLAPVLLLIGLSRVSGIAGSLLLNLEAVFTMALALAVFGEHLGRRAALGAGAVVASAAVLGLAGGGSEVDLVGFGCIVAACAAWGIDNNLTQRLSGRDPFAVVRAKAAVAAVVNLGVAVIVSSPWPSGRILLAALVVGGASYGLSVLLDAYALRLVGAAREAAYFATAPAFGVAASIVLLGESLTAADVVAIVVMAFGVRLLVTDRHEHAHEHQPLAHDHRHRHDDGHHDHHHDDLVAEHAHPHVHAAVTHAHPHVSDVHHRHSHGQV